MGAKRLSDDRAPSISRALSGDVKLRACIRMLTTPFGKKCEAVRLLAAELGYAPSSLYHWRRRYREAGPHGFSHNRADKGIPRVYSEAEFESVIAAAQRLRRRPSVKLSQEWRALGLSGSYETFRRWIRAIQAFGIPAASVRRLSA